MSIVDNQGENKSNKKKALICTIIAMVVVVGGIAAAIGISGKKAQPVFAEENVNESAEPPEDSADLADDLKIEEELPEHEEDMEEDWEAVYTTENSDEESLIQLVKDTILSADHQFEQSVEENGESSKIAVLLRSISDAGMGGADFDDLFIPADTDFILDSETQGWTYWDMAGALGQCLFDEKDLETADLYKGEMLKRFVAYGVFYFNVEELNNWQAEGIVDTLFPADIDYDIDFTVSFDHENRQYLALVGKVGESYRVLDVIHAEDADSILVKEEVEPVEPEPEPEQNVAPVYEENVDSDDPYDGDPEYKGEIEGYIYIPHYGYVLDQGGGVIDYDPNPHLPAYEACIYDENGNCILHEHRGHF